CLVPLLGPDTFLLGGAKPIFNQINAFCGPTCLLVNIMRKLE
ncbi:MAG: hypothetical protein RLZZ136_1677, partial [Pseudomonadota bacterium]